MKNIKIFKILFFLLSGVIVSAQNTQLDSLNAVLDSQDEDTSKVHTLNQIAATVYRTDTDEAIRFSTEAIKLAGKINFQKGLAMAYKNLGLGAYMQGNYTEAFKNWETSLGLFEELGDDQGIANLVGNLGSIYYMLGKNFEAIEYNLRALKIAEKLNDSTRIATLLLNIGSVYSEQPSTLDTARSYYLRALVMGELIAYTDLLGLGYINLGGVYFKQEEYDSAQFYFEKALTIVTSSIDIAGSLMSIGKTYTQRGDYYAAIKYLQDALLMAQKESAQLETSRILLGLASAYSKQGNPQVAIDYYMQARTISEEGGFNIELSEVFEGLAHSYAEISDFQNAFKYSSLQDTIDNTIYRIETENKTNNLMFTYQLDKKDDEIEILEQQAEIEQLTSRRQRAIIIAIGLFGLLLLMLAVGFYNRMQFIRKTKGQIEAQKDEIESQRDEIEAQRDQVKMQHDMVLAQNELITASINYAQRIQSAMLPSSSLLAEVMPEYFIVFKPKDIVSGDFYWVKEVQDHLVIVGADCTGHGVPGACMSMLGITLLNDLIGERCFDAPGAILEQLRLKIKELLVQEGGDDEQKDGMDAVIAILNKNTRELHFSGANNPLYIIRNKALANGNEMEQYSSVDNDDYQLFELKGDKQPIGVHWEETDFRTHSIKLQEQDTFYMFSDGFIDQFGGENRKKYKALNFKKLLLSVQEEAMDRQKQTIEKTFDNWRGDYEQIDDVSVIGIRI